MLWELLTHLLDRGSHLARDLGQAREAVAIAARHRRCHQAWAGHLAAAKGLVLEAATDCPGRGLVLVLGSGHCLDVPLPELAAAFNRVVLVDIHHPRAVRRAVKQYGNVAVETADVTGLGAAAVRAARGKAALPEPVPAPELFLDRSPDLVVSLNLLSQLPIPFANLLADRFPEAALDAFCQGLVTAHLAWLSRFRGRVCLMADVTWQRLDKGEVVWEKDALRGVALPPPQRAWNWDIAPRPEESWAYDRRNLVHGYTDFGKAAKGKGKP